jgi:hypothetical protein
LSITGRAQDAVKAAGARVRRCGEGADPNDIFLIKTETDLMISTHTEFGSGEGANAKHQSAGRRFTTTTGFEGAGEKICLDSL